MIVNIPNNIVQEVLDAHYIQQRGSVWSIESRCLATQKIEYHVWEIVSAIIIRDFTKTKRVWY